MSQNSYLREFCAQVSKIVFCSWFDRFTLIRTVWVKNRLQNSYLREFCAQVSKIVFLADLTVYGLLQLYEQRISQDSYLQEFCAQVSKIVFLADLNGLLQFYEKKIHKTHISASSVHKYHKSADVFYIADLTVYGLLQLYEQKSQNSYLRKFCAQLS